LYFLQELVFGLILLRKDRAQLQDLVAVELVQVFTSLLEEKDFAVEGAGFSLPAQSLST
jgi:hypothetical protein